MIILNKSISTTKSNRKIMNLYNDLEFYSILERKKIEGNKTRYYLQANNLGNRPTYISSLKGPQINSKELQELQGVFIIEYQGKLGKIEIKDNKAFLEI